MRVISYIILGILGTAAMGIVFGYAIMLLWNWLMPELFGLKEITYWQGIGIFILAKFIFGFGMGGGGSDSKSGKKNHERDDDEQPRESWTAYDEWWANEGKKAFDKYAETKDGTGNK
jgi:hypothetical protein